MPILLIIINKTLEAVLQPLAPFVGLYWAPILSNLNFDIHNIFGDPINLEKDISHVYLSLFFFLRLLIPPLAASGGLHRHILT